MPDYATQSEFDALKEEVRNPPKDRVEGWLGGIFGEHVAAGNQALYANTQAFKIDPSIFTANERGLSIAGVEVIRFPWVERLENSGLSSEERARRREDESRVLEGMRLLRRAQEEDESGSGGNSENAQQKILVSEQDVSSLKTGIRNAHRRITSLQALPRHLRNTNARVGAIERRIDEARQTARQSTAPRPASNLPVRRQLEQIEDLERRVNALAQALS